MVAMARAFLSNPRWVWDAAKVLSYEIEDPTTCKKDITNIIFFCQLEYQLVILNVLEKD